jgi:hypothetical protein
MLIKRYFVALALVAVLFAGAVPQAEAGIMDSITGLFSKASSTVKGWFSGGGTKEFEELLQKVIASQEVVAEKQNTILDGVSRGGNSSLDPKSAEYQTKMDELAEASRSNEELYTNLLKVRQELVDNKKDVSKYEEHFARITETQHNLEEGYQAIQDASRQEGAFTPPAEAAAAAGGAIWMDPEVQQYMDEWLAANGLDEFGRLLGGVVIAVADPDMGGKTREQWLWENMFSNRGKITGNTLEAYINKRLKGGAAASAAAQASANTGGASQMERSSSTSPAVSGATVASDTSSTVSLGEVESTLNDAMTTYQQMAEAGEGDTAEAQELLSNIQTLKAQRDQMVAEGTAAANQ